MSIWPHWYTRKQLRMSKSCSIFIKKAILCLLSVSNKHLHEIWVKALRPFSLSITTNSIIVYSIELVLTEINDSSTKWAHLIYCYTSIRAEIPVGSRISQLDCSSSRWRNITMVLKHLHTTAETEKHNFSQLWQIILAPLTYSRSRYEDSVPDLLEMPAKLFFSCQNLMSFLKAKISNDSCKNKIINWW